VTVDKQQLANDYSPCLVLYPEYEDKGGADYYPRDVRLVLAHVRWRRHEDTWWGLNICAKIARTWPTTSAALIGVIGAAWGGLIGYWAAERDQFSGAATLSLAFIAAIPTSLLVLLFVRHALTLVLWKRFFYVVGFPLVIGLPLSAIIGLSEGAPTAAKIVLAAATGGYAVSWLLALASLRGRKRWLLSQRPDRILTAIENEVDDPKSRRVFLVYWGVGAASDKEQHRKAYVAVPKGDFPVTVYARVVDGENEFKGFTAVQYWMAYFYNDWENTHEMDWEQVTVYLRRAGSDSDDATPVACAFSAHFSGSVLPWDQVTKCKHTDPDGGQTHPVTYVARGSHANYPRPGRHRILFRFAGLELSSRDLPFKGSRATPLRYVDEAPDGEPLHPQRVVVLPEPDDPLKKIWHHAICQPSCDDDDESRLCARDFRWLNIKGKWGSPGGFFGDAAPQSPPEQLAWDPFVWLDDCEPFRPSRAQSFLSTHPGAL
jgi:hypothetical protein